MANPHYQMILSENLPHLAGDDVERVLLILACRYARNHNVEQVREMYRAYPILTGQLGMQLLKPFNEVDILHKIIQIRDLFVRFRRYINLPSVEYGPYFNYIRVSPEYRAQWEGSEEPQYAKDFRIHGLARYNLCKFFFVPCRAAPYYFEPRDLAAEVSPVRDSDDEDNGFSDIEGNLVEEEPQEDSEEKKAVEGP